MINFVLCDDNIMVLSKLKEMLNSIFLKYDFDATVKLATNSTKELIKFVNSNRIDVLFMDIDLNTKETGIEIAKLIRKSNKSLYLIFVTAHFEYIISSFECKTFDFIQKPFTYARLERTILRIFDDIDGFNSRFIDINNSGQIINRDSIDFIEKDGMKAIYKTINESFESYCSFNQIETTLPQNFVRCHKSFIVNINNIHHVDSKSNTIFFQDGLIANNCIGPKYKNKFMEVVKNDRNF